MRMANFQILLVDDNVDEMESCKRALERLPNVEVVAEPKSSAAVKLLGSGAFDLVVTDLRMPVVDGLDILRVVQSVDPDLPVVIMTGYPSVDTAVSALKDGAAEYLSKPVNLDELFVVAERLLDTRRLRTEHRVLARQVDRPFAFGEMIGVSEGMQSVFEAVRKLAASDVDVVVTGETGTGKELVARSLHRERSGRTGRFVPVDCASIPESLMESEIFGHERGAFTGADQKSIGLMEFAHRGTFFLDEVNSLPMSMQAKLLRALEQRRFRPVGATKETEVDIRVIAASNGDLGTLVSEGSFREDLYYRLNVGSIEIPPLRDRSEDIPLLVEHFLSEGGSDADRGGISADALEALCAFDWPGNIRQLKNAIRRALAMARDPVIEVDDLPPEVLTFDEPPGMAGTGSFFEQRQRHQDDFEKEYIVEMLRACSGDVSEAAGRAEVPRGTFYRLMKKHDLNADVFRTSGGGAA